MTDTLQDRITLLPIMAQAAGKILTDPRFRNVEKTKINALDLATQGDLASEKYLMEAIQEYFPKDKIMSEETAEDIQAAADEYLWVIDPVDGTSNYARGRNYSAVSIGLLMNDEILAGVVFNPFVNELYSATKSHGSFLNGTQIHCSQETDLVKSIFMASSGYTPDVMRTNFGWLFQLKELSRIFSEGSAVMQMCEVAAGRFEAYFHTTHKPWDNAAALLILRESGAVTVDRHGKPVDWRSPEVFAGNQALIEKCVQMLK